MRRLILTASLSVLAVGAQAATLTEAAVKALPRVSAKAEHFVPRGWTLENTAEGDLNGDGRADAAITLVEAMPANADAENPPERERALILLIRNADGYGRAGGNGTLLQCTRCGGAFYGAMETPVDVSIAKGVLIVKQDHGSRNVVSTTHRFRHDPASGAFKLIGLDQDDTDRATGERINESANFLTGVKITQRFQYNPETEKETRQSINRTRVSRTLKPFEAVGRDTPA